MKPGEDHSLIDEAVVEDLRRLVATAPGTTFDDLFGLFVADGRERIAGLREAIISADRDRIVATSHSLIGSSGSFGANRVAHLSRELEQLGRADDLEAARPVLDRLASAFELTVRALAPGGDGATP